MDIDQTLKHAVAHHQAGRLVEAHQLYKQVLAVNPDEPDALRLLGQLTYSGGNPAAAADLIRRAISLRPNVVDYHIDLAAICLLQSDFTGAVAGFEKVLKMNPFASSQTHLDLARALTNLDRYDEAIIHAQLAVDKKPSADTLGFLGELFLATDRVQEAVDRLKAAVDLAPERGDLLVAYALALQHRGDLDLAEAAFGMAVSLQPQSPDLLNALGYLLVLRRKLPEAMVRLRAAIALRPQFPQAHYHLALAFTGLGQTDAALAAYRIALEQQPRFPQAWEGLGRVLLDQREYNAAVTAFSRLVSLSPTASGYQLLATAHGGLDQLDAAILASKKAVEIAADSAESADAHDALGNHLRWTGQLGAAMTEFRRALELDPSHKQAHSKLLYTMLASDRFSPAEILTEHIEWGRRHTGSITPLRRLRNLADPDRRLRIGYISNNFRNQAVSSFVLPIVRHHDRIAFEVFCYSDVANPDTVTSQFQKHTDSWRDCATLSDEELARKIREDRIDLLVELTGHIGHGRLGTLAYRPAPVQISYIGYQGTTGTAAVDYVLTDEWTDPPEKAEANYIEKPFRLPESFFVYQPPGDAPLVGPLPAKSAGFVMFGCLNAVWKATPRAVKLWARVMSEVPGSKMMLLTTHCEETRHRLLEGFARGGIAPERIQLVYRSSVADYFRRYNAMDLALDPVPFNGHTTTCDAAWMGCPTISLSGQIYAHRYGGSVMRNLNLPDLATESENAYIATAIASAHDLNRLEKIRGSLRFTMQDSIITDGPRFTRNLEQAYRTMWREWCASPQS